MSLLQRYEERQVSGNHDEFRVIQLFVGPSQGGFDVKYPYPYLLYKKGIAQSSILMLSGDPYIIDLSANNPLIDSIDVSDQKAFQAVIDKEMGTEYFWGLSGYLEKRETLLRNCSQMVAEERYYHLGLDIIAPAETELLAPLDAVVQEAGYEEGAGNYGGFVLLKHEGMSIEPFFSFYGHLSFSSLPRENSVLRAGEAFARIGHFHENGNWFHHTHLQIITPKGLEKGYISKGYCSEKDLREINDLCPNPLPLFKI